jgi:SAM-dependent methyltransferase
VRIARSLYSVTIAASSLLLFLVQPMIAKALLPRFGGSAGVWVTCMLFFQVVLLAGYAYSYVATRHLSRRVQGLGHVVLLLASLLVLPLTLGLNPGLNAGLSAGMSQGSGPPAAAILLTLARSVGLPYFLLSTTSPLLVSWYSAAGAGRFPYRLFALSNAASLAALLIYPIAIEPLLPVTQQLAWWSAGYAVVAILAAGVSVHGALHGARYGGWRGGNSRTAAEVTPQSPWMWIGLSACAAALWFAVANHLSQEVAAVPFLWVLPLSLYLLSFIVCFAARGWYQSAVFRWLLPAAWIGMCWRLARPGGLPGELAVWAASLLVCCIFCHGEVARTKPDPLHGLAFFYLMVALGGALGAVFVGLVAPNVFNGYLELPIAITASILLALVLVYGYPPRRLVRLAAVAVLAFVLATRYRAAQGDVVHLRNFYGALQVSDAGAGETAARSLYNGRTLHGVEFLSPARARTATAYYGPESGAGRLLSKPGPARRVGVVGLGVGTLAVYGRPGDEFRFYEINPAVVQVAWQYFHFLGGSQAMTDVVTGDGRLALEHEPLQSFDAIVLDAFSDDSIPVHLLTLEAFQMYFRRLRPEGVLAIHLTNRYLELDSVVAAVAAALGKHSALVHSEPDRTRHISAADWAIVGDLAGTPIRRSARVWTDGYSNLFQVWK